MSNRLQRAGLAIVCVLSSGTALSQTVVGPDVASDRYNRLRDLSVREERAIAPAAPDIFGTAAVGAGVTFYDARFRRVARTDRDDPRVVGLAASLRGLEPLEQLARVHDMVRARIRLADDLDTMKVADFWANAGETLERGAGDSEDLAIVEMQALKAAGFDSRNLYLSVGRRKGVGNHVVLVARTPQGFYALDGLQPGPVAASATGWFTPVLTMGEGKSWIHGRRIHGTTLHAGAL